MNFTQDWLTQCRAMCKLAKYVGEPVVWASRQNHRGSMSAQSQVLDQSLVTIPGLSFIGEAQTRIWGPYHKYSLMFKSAGKAQTVLRLEVYPPHMVGHRDPDGRVYYGPHIHLGDDRAYGSPQVVRAILPNINASSMDRWIYRFRRHVRLLDNGSDQLLPPFADDLFGL